MESDTPTPDHIATVYMNTLSLKSDPASWWAHTEIKRLRAELAAMRQQRDEATAWRPIEIAPMDGTVVMLYGDGRVTVGSWFEVADDDCITVERLAGIGGEDLPQHEPAYWESRDGGFTEEHPPTHWMPLPQPPREKEGGGA